MRGCDGAESEGLPGIPEAVSRSWPARRNHRLAPDGVRRILRPRAGRVNLSNQDASDRTGRCIVAPWETFTRPRQPHGRRRAPAGFEGEPSQVSGGGPQSAFGTAGRDQQVDGASAQVWHHALELSPGRPAGGAGHVPSTRDARSCPPARRPILLLPTLRRARQPPHRAGTDCSTTPAGKIAWAKVAALTRRTGLPSNPRVPARNPPEAWHHPPRAKRGEGPRRAGCRRAVELLLRTCPGRSAEGAVRLLGGAASDAAGVCLDTHPLMDDFAARRSSPRRPRLAETQRAGRDIRPRPARFLSGGGGRI